MVKSELVELPHEFEALLRIVGVITKIRDPINDNHFDTIVLISGLPSLPHESVPAKHRFHAGETVRVQQGRLVGPSGTPVGAAHERIMIVGGLLGIDVYNSPAFKIPSSEAEGVSATPRL